MVKKKKFIKGMFIAVIVIFLIIITACLTAKNKNFENHISEEDIQGQENTESGNSAETSAGTSAGTSNGTIIQEDKQEKDIEERPIEGPKLKDPIEEKIKNMTLEEKIGQMVIAGFDGYTMDDNIRILIEEYRVGGFILFKRNIENTDQLLELIRSLKSTNAELKNSIPLFISVDEEGGRVSRMPAEFKKLPSNSVIGQANNGDLSYKIGEILAEQLKGFGFNMNFAPVLDINSNPDNTVIGDRSFGSDPQIVSKLGIQTMKGIQNGGIIPVVKHFPGHGDTIADSHIDLPVIEHDMERLRNFELIPFKDAIKNGADAVMIAHILLNRIDPDNPASLSKIVISDILRGELNFKGIVISDDMTMDAIDKNYSIGDASVKSVNAGSDIILVCHGFNKAVEVIEYLKKAAEEGVISEERINESVYRILKLKEKYNLSDNIEGSINIEKINNDISLIFDNFQ